MSVQEHAYASAAPAASFKSGYRTFENHMSGLHVYRELDCWNA
jgi:hypothetical protein